MNPLNELFSKPHVGPNHVADLVRLPERPTGPPGLHLDGKPVTAAFARAALVAARVPACGVRAFLTTACPAIFDFTTSQVRGTNGRWVKVAGGEPPADEPPETKAARALAVNKLQTRLNTTPGLTKSQRTEYGAAATGVLKSMTGPALHRWNANVSKMSFAPSLAAVPGAITTALTKLGDNTPIPDGVVGGCICSPPDPRDQNPDRVTVVVDGGVPGEPEGSMGSVHGVYAHEFTHAIDGAARSISSTPAWDSAWNDEIARASTPPSDYARSSPKEGFAEFGRLVFTNPNAARQLYPRCTAVWKSHGLI